jgi:undecaprenyl pyrophosphate phosphatase UppP
MGMLLATCALSFDTPALMLSILRSKMYRSIRRHSGRALLNNPFLTCKNALLLGMAQGGALLIPGVSRFATTFFVATLLGLSQPKALKLSFIIFIPLLAGSFFLKGLPFILTHSNIFLTPQTIGLYLALTIIATTTFWGTYHLAKRNSLWYFGIYMLLPITTTLIYIYTH